MGRFQHQSRSLGLPWNVQAAALVTLMTWAQLASAQTGLELSGRDEDALPPAQWRLVDPGTEKEVASVQRKWGFAAAAPGEYELRLTYEGSDAPEVVWQRVTVPEQDAVRIAIKSGVNVAGRSPDDEPPYRIRVFRGETKEIAALLHRRWGYSPLPPGEYRVSLVPEDSGGVELPWTSLRVMKDEVARVAVDSGVEVSGRTEDDDPPYRFHVFRAGGDEKVAVLHRRFGFAPLPLGKYRLALQPEDSGGLDLPWTEFEVKKGEVAKVAIDSGLEVSGRDKDDNPPYRFHVFHAGGEEQVAVLHRRFGFAPLTPGKYRLALQPEDSGGLDLPWTEFEVEKGAVAKVAVNSGLEVAGRSPDDDPPYRFHVFRAGGDEQVAVLHRRFGYAPLTPGKYRLSLQPEDSGGLDLNWTDFQVKDASVTRIVIASGLEVSGRSADDEPPFRFYVYHADSREKVAVLHRRFGFAPLTPGEYLVTLQPEDAGAVEVAWSRVTVAADVVTPVRIASGIELIPAAPMDEPPADMYVLHARTRELANVWHRRWGYAALPPGEYIVSTVAPGDDAEGKQKRVRVKRDEVLRLSFAELAPGDAIERPENAGLARATPGHTTLELFWEPPPAADLKDQEVFGYRVFRAGASAPIHGQRILKAPKFLDIGLTNGREYQYTIVAVLSGGGELKYAVVAGTPGKESDSAAGGGPLDIVPGPPGVRPPSIVPPPRGAGIPR